MKQVWVDVRDWDKDQVTNGIENGADAIYVSPENISSVKELGLIPVISNSDLADFKVNDQVIEVEIKTKEDEEKIANLNSNAMAIVSSQDWTIIPLENLIAQDKKIIYPVSTVDEAKVALTILEKGVWGILIKNNDVSVHNEIIKLAKGLYNQYLLKEMTIKDIQKISMGDRVCIDTITNMKQGEGVLIGNYSNAFFLVHSESVENPYVNPRPFRVNAGAVHAYVMMPDNKTKYLDELRTGDDVLILDYQGKTYISSVGRLKIEKRPMLNIIAEVDGKDVSVVLQNAETIRLTLLNGDPISVVKLKKGDRVLGYTEEGGRHFGYKVTESIQEK